jgi:hypothetical protein
MNKLSDTQAAGLDGVSWDHRVTGERDYSNESH